MRFFMLAKSWGNSINKSRAKCFWNCLQGCRLVDLGFKGPKYTWTNKRHRFRTQLIFERLDSFVANDSWIKKFPNSLFTHLPYTKSDHCPLLISLYSRTNHTSPKPFRIELMWCRHPTFVDLVHSSFPPDSTLLRSVNAFQTQATNWNKEVFGNIVK